MWDASLGADPPKASVMVVRRLMDTLRIYRER